MLEEEAGSKVSPIALDPQPQEQEAKNEKGSQNEWSDRSDRSVVKKDIEESESRCPTN